MAESRLGAVAPLGRIGGLLRQMRRTLSGIGRRGQRIGTGPGQRPVVALVSDAIFPYHCGGREIRYHEVSRRLTEYADVHLYTMHWWEGPGTRKNDAVTLHAISPLRSLYTHTRRSLWQAVVFALGCLRLLWAQFDVLEADHMPLVQIPVLWLITAVKRKRFVVTWHEVWGASYWRQYLGWAGVGAWLIEELSMRLPDHIIAASSHTAQRLSTSLGPRASITVAPNGIDLDAVRAAYPDPAATDLVVVSRLMAHKRISLLLDVVAFLHAEGNPVTCRIIGDGPERDDLLAQARAQNIDWAVDFRHDVREQKEVYSLVKAAKVFVLPSTREGFGIAVLEALACGVPVVTTSDDDNLAQHLAARSSNGVVCEPTVTALAEAVLERLAQHDLPADGRSDGDDAWLAEYTWEATTDRVVKALGI